MKRKGAQKVSRHRKRYWRKGTDINDVHEHLVEERRQLRQGGDLSKKSDSQLFQIDRSPIKDPTPITKERGPKTIQLKGFSSLVPSSLVPPVKVSVPKKKKKANKEKKNPKTRPKLEKTKTNSAYDLWAETKELPKTSLEPQLEDYYLRQTKKKIPKQPKTLKEKSTDLPKVEICHPGASYNPEFEEHQELMRTVLEDEKSKLDSEKSLEKKLSLIGNVDESARLVEQSEGLFSAKKEDSDSDPESGEESEYKPEPAVTKADRKLRSTRAKQAAAKQKLLEKLAEKQQNKRSNQIYRLRSLKGEVESIERKSLEKSQRKRERIQKQRLTGAARLSKYRYESAEIEMKLSNQLVGELRKIKPEGNLISDRYKSLQRRNIIESRVLQKRHRKYKEKITEKRSHRNAEKRLAI